MSAESRTSGRGAPARRKARPAALASLVTVAACGATADHIVTPPQPGEIVVAFDTNGFLKDDGYTLLLDGESRGAIDAFGEVTIPGLEEGTYELSLDDVAENCQVDPVTVEVTGGATVDAALSVLCAADEASSYTIRFGRARPNLDTGEITECPFSICATEEDWDLYVYYSSLSEPHSIIRQNQTTSVQIAHLDGIALESLAEEDFDGATFGTELVADAFDAGRVILIRSDQAFVYALGNPVEDETAQTLTFDAVLIFRP